ncbi:HMP-PP phosphatase [Escherichia coli]|nr:HMP-PP phosphatase [Escherichia coli]RDO58572.1 HMP-PP phosphatase [Escherichia coli]RDO84066.1 HMP-PP phosphatase [Escherichia coli]RDQ13976.1 HMP-PP phosphatase [Escherichia coli]
MARLAAFDMDGTLLMPDHHLGEKTLSTLARLRERDITLTFATGRHALEMQHILGALSLDAYLITGNGTRVHSLEGELLHRDDLPADVAELVLYQQWDTAPACISSMTTVGLPGKRSLRCCRHLSIAVFVIR